VRDRDVHVLFRILRHSRPDDGDIFLPVASRRAVIDERCQARLEIRNVNLLSYINQ
jgi:hypothetical protein